MNHHLNLQDVINPKDYSSDIYINIRQYNWKIQEKDCIRCTQKVPNNWNELVDMLKINPDCLVLMNRVDYYWGSGCWKYNKEEDKFEFINGNWDSSG